MATLTDFVIAILQSLIELVFNFASVATSDILSPFLILTGGAVMVVSVGAFAYVALGALGAELGIIGVGSSSGRPPQRE
ncbi:MULTISPECIES: hypothetical protein [unclassified Haloferax]|uniref:hypothetical protein n=1 Tax=Haloferax TaxID=2251 RepID=UPI0002B0060C|nr:MULTISPECIES: hypothetical protein [unclassified Haloferax]ELZ56669.1 hypothetical protein C460_13739 [Haloferax sp. ATCC BAA-646]ELZ68114.1 hypothetical protein C459_00932 [Haloferax sp. ATCC BAA-645]ELZ68718.1 hypothetical protein C458_08865 [Haloferax sp. ATCC BAA-644]